ncbi:helix-turn-helix domain-containing protein [Streptomyces sp. NPDC002659]|uniref:MmyB family transcriptional regulator n=1 Tax=Streptomyces sp. NPDC002659 TaxID=3364656 RepID=UPI0036BEA20F
MVVRLIEEVRQAKHLTKQALAERLGLTPRSLRNWMARASCLQATEVARLVEALKMSAENRTNLYILTGQMPPAPPVGELLRTPEVDLYQDMIDDLRRCPSVVYSDCWDVVITNRAFREVFGGVRRHATAHPMRNTQGFIFFHPDAPQLLGAGDVTAFREHWLMPALAHYSATLQQRPEDPRLQAIEQEIDRRPALRRAYRRAPGWIAENGDIAIRPSARLFWDPRIGRAVDAHIITEHHQGYQPMTLQRATFIFRERRPKAVSTAFEQSALFALPGDHTRA